MTFISDLIQAFYPSIYDISHNDSVASNIQAADLLLCGPCRMMSNAEHRRLIAHIYQNTIRKEEDMANYLDPF